MIKAARLAFLIGALLVMLKTCGAINCSWWFVASPFLLVAIVAILWMVFMGLLMSAIFGTYRTTK